MFPRTKVAETVGEAKVMANKALHRTIALPRFARTGDRRAVKNGATDVLEENPPDQPLLVVDNKTAFRRVVDAFFRSCEHILGLVANERLILPRSFLLCSRSRSRRCAELQPD